MRRNLQFINKEAVRLLARAEEAQAKARNLPAFKFSKNEEMLAAIEKERAAAASVQAAMGKSEAA